MKHRVFTRALALGLSLVATTALAAPGPAFQKTATIPAPDDRWDFASWDAAHSLLLVAHGKDVLVIDPARQSVHSVGSLQGAHGVVAIPGTNQLLVSSARDNTVRIIDETSGAEVASIAVGEDPDAVILSRDGQTAYVMAAKAGAVSIVDLAHHAETGRIALKPALEVPVLVTPTLMAVNDEDASEIELADLATRKSLGSIPLTGCEGPTGMAFDPETGLSLSACANGKAAIVDLRARHLVGLVPIGMGPDTAIWDRTHKRFLVPCGKSGTLSVISLASGKPVAEAQSTTEPSARTAALDPATHHIYLPAASFGPAEAGKRPAMVPGSFHIVVMSPAG